MLLSSHGQILIDPNFWMFFIPVLLILLHIPLLFVMITKWLMEGYFDINGLKEKKFLILTSIAKDLGMENKTVAPQKNLNFFSWLVYQKRVRDYYAPYVANIGKIEGDIWESRKKVKPDSIPRYFYGALFSAQPLSDILCTKEGAEPYIMAASQRTSQGKHSIYHRIIHYKSPALDLPKCNVVPTHEWVDSISPEPDDVNFISDEEFSKKFDLTGDDQVKIREIFSKGIRAIMLDKPDWTWRLENNSILTKYSITGEDLNQMSDLKSSLDRVSKLFEILKNGHIATKLSKEEIEQDIPDETIDKKLYNKRMAIFGCLLGCGTSLILLALLMLFGFVVKIKLPFLFQGLFLGFVGFSLFQYGKSEWKRNKKLKADGKVTKS